MIEYPVPLVSCLTCSFISTACNSEHCMSLYSTGILWIKEYYSFYHIPIVYKTNITLFHFRQWNIFSQFEMYVYAGVRQHMLQSEGWGSNLDGKVQYCKDYVLSTIL